MKTRNEIEYEISKRKEKFKELGLLKQDNTIDEEGLMDYIVRIEKIEADIRHLQWYVDYEAPYKLQSRLDERYKLKENDNKNPFFEEDVVSAVIRHGENKKTKK